MNAERVTLSPSDVARQVGVSTDTLRHYERKGLLPSPVRSSAGYRRYSVETVKRVQLIQRALVIGFSLDELAQVLRDRERGSPPCKAVRDLVKQRLVDLDDRLRQLSALRIELRHLIADWDRRIARAAGKPAHLLETLGERPVIERQRIDRTARERRPFTRRPNTSRSQ
jgi:MerR family transcriptional regulator, Zn(II)-responsive regulator of zntA